MFVLCEPSQNGLFAECPHRQSEKSVSLFMTLPSLSTKSTVPFTRIEPFALTYNLTFSDTGTPFSFSYLFGFNRDNREVLVSEMGDATLTLSSIQSDGYARA